MCRTACVALLATAPLGSEHGAAPVIAVVSPSQVDRAMLEALNRFRGEAAAVGFAVTIVPVSKGAPSAQMESAARAVPGVATVAFVRGADPTDLDVWFTDRLDGQTIVDHVSVESNRADRTVVLAVKAVDVLRARMFGLLARRGRPAGAGRGEGPTAPATAPSAAAGSSTGMNDSAASAHDPAGPREALAGGRYLAAAPPPAPAPSSPSAAPSPVPPRQLALARDSSDTARPTPPDSSLEASVVDRPADNRPPTRLGVGVGIGALRTFPALGNAMLLLIRGQFDLGAKSLLRITLGGTGSKTVVDASAGRADIRDTLLLLEAGALPWGRRLQPVFAGGLGLHYFNADGTAMPAQPYKGLTVGQLVGAASLSVGVRARINRHLGVMLDTGAQILFPQVQVQVAGTNTQSAGRPTLLATLAVEGRL